MRERETTRPWSSTYVLLSALLVFWLFEKDISVVALCFLAVGDPAASIIGEKFGRRKIWGKSLEGTAACFLSCLVVGVFLANTVLSVSLLAILAGSFCAALVELLPLHLNDNFTIPILPAGVMTAVG
jgi:glycerol-3-phosphate acyltransferase PlsY